MRSFCSFLVFRPNEIDLIQSVCAEANWSTRSIPDPSTRFKFTTSGVSEVIKADALAHLGAIRGEEEYGRLLVLEGEQSEADNIIQLICAANLILEGFADQYSPPSHGFEIPNEPTKREEIFRCLFRTQGYFEKFLHRETLPVAVAVAAKAWTNSRLIYAIHKLAQSYTTESVTPHSMHPHYGQSFEKHTSEYSSHVKTSVAINLAYSAIQEIGLDVRASRDNKRWLDNKAFVWNPKVLNDIKARLEKSGIDCDRTIDWIVRGEKSEVDVHPTRDTPGMFSDGEMIRDREMSLPDAINACEYLRNHMTAHAFSRSTPLLGPYEVYNTQQVARLLILSKCGLFNVWTEDLVARHI